MSSTCDRCHQPLTRNGRFYLATREQHLCGVCLQSDIDAAWALHVAALVERHSPSRIVAGCRKRSAGRASVQLNQPAHFHGSSQ